LEEYKKTWYRSLEKKFLITNKKSISEINKPAFIMRKEVRMNSLPRTVLLVVLGLYLSSCENFLVTGCVGCHTDKELLEEIADPIEYSEDSGEG